MTGECGKQCGKDVLWELVRCEDGRVELTFLAQKEGAEIADYDYVISTMLPPWADYAAEITDLKLDSRIAVVGKQCFRGMEQLKRVEFQKNEDQTCALREIGDKAFWDCRRLPEIQIPDSVERIGAGAFQNAECLTSVKIGAGLKSMGNEVFSYDVSLKELSITSAQLEQVGKSQFKLVHRLRECVCPADSAGIAELRKQIEMIHQVGGGEKVQVKDDTLVDTVTDGMREYLDGCIHGELNETVKYCLRPIDGECYVLEITGTGDMPEWSSQKYQPWRHLAEKITEIRVEEGITAIGNHAFDGLTNLLSVSLSGTVKRTGVCSFGECISLTELSFPEGLRALGCRSLWGCVGLETIRLPKTLIFVDLMALAYCPNVRDVYYAGSKAQWENEVTVDNMMKRNQVLLDAQIHFGETDDDVVSNIGETEENRKKYLEEVAKIAGLLKSHGDGRLHSVAIDLGESFLYSKIGDSTLVIFPEGITMLIDTGVCGARRHLTDFLRSIGLETLDYQVFTHTHGDHFGGALEVIQYIYEEKNGKIGEVWYSSGAMDSQMVIWAMEKLTEKRVPYRQIKTVEDGSGERPLEIVIDGVEIFVYGPNAQDICDVNDAVGPESANNSSLVLKFCYGETVFLTAGDIYQAKERYLIDTYGKETFSADIIKMNHHGNFQGNTQPWIEATSPRIAYVETDGNGNNDVMRRYTEAGAVCYSTGLDGMLHFSMGREKDIDVYCRFDSKLR